MLIPPLGGPERKLTEMRVIRGVSWTPDAKWLAFSGPDSEEWLSIWAIEVDTLERRRLTKFQSTARQTEGGALGDILPSVSPDGQALAFAREASNFVHELYVLPITRDLRPTGEPTRITDQRYTEVGGFAWTTDGREVVYAAGGLRGLSLWRVPVSGKQAPRSLTYALRSALQPAIAYTTSRLIYAWGVLNVNLWRLDLRNEELKLFIGSTYESIIPQYSPDGSRIAFQSNRSGNNEIWTCDADGSNCQQLTSFGGPLCGTPRWSPDGRWLGLDSRVEGWSEIHVIAADGGTPRRVTDSAGFSNTRPAWSHDGRWIYFTSDRSARNEIWKIPVGGGHAIQVTRSGGAGALESPDGKYLYYIREPSQKGLFRMSTERGEETQVLPDSVRLVWAGFSVTTKGVYFVPFGAETIQLLDGTTGKLKNLATLDTRIWHGICVSPDDTYVVWGQVDRNTMDLMLGENFR